MELVDKKMMLAGIVLKQRFLLNVVLGHGSYGVIYRALDTKYGDDVAVKIEESENDNPQLPFEAHVYRYMQGGPGIPRLRWYGVSPPYNVLAVQRLGLSLEYLFHICDGGFSLKTVLQLAIQMFTALEYFHSMDFVHRDIKPDNFIMGKGADKDKLFIIDFGLCSRYRDEYTQEHIKMQRVDFIGTMRYGSVNALRGLVQSRRDDLESLMYSLIYMMRGSLPWQGIEGVTKNQRKLKIRDIKQKIRLRDLCGGMPFEFEEVLQYIRGLHFAEDPNYAYIKSTFNRLFRDLGYEHDDVYDWSNSTDQRVIEMQTTSGFDTRTSFGSSSMGSS